MTPIGIEILLPEGDPNGLRIVKIPGWIGRAFVIPRSQIKYVKTLREANYPAIYFLFGEGEEQDTAYIGQTDNFLRRLTQQGDAKDYWSTAVVFTGESDIDAQYLERRCVEDARKAGRYEIKNATSAPGRNISDFQKAAQQKFFEYILLITALLGYPLFEDPKEQKSDGKIYTFELEHASAKGNLLETQEFIVYKNSTARIREVASLSKGSIALRQQLVSENVLKKLDEHSYIFAKDYIFKSPSAAADVVGAHARNGWIVWKDTEGKTLDENVRK